MANLNCANTSFKKSPTARVREEASYAAEIIDPLDGFVCLKQHKGQEVNSFAFVSVPSEALLHRNNS
jgi:hypothetical protein